MAASFESDLAALVGAMCNGAISAGDARRLDARLTTDPDAREFYNNYLFLHGELYSQHAAADVVQSLRIESREPERAPRRNRWRGVLAIAAALVGVAAVSSWATYSLSQHWQRGANVAASADAQTVARVTATRNCSWADGTEAGYGSRLKTGQTLNLATGLIEVTFDDGAVVVLEGPATFDVESPSRAQLHDGRLAAVVPERARGFEVVTSRLNVVDLGTEFGVMAESAGATEVHVFNGLVKAQLLDEAGRKVRTVELNTAEAARIEPAAAIVARIPARDDEFVRSLTVASGPHDGLLAYDGFNYPAGPLDEQNGGFGWAGPWFTVESDVKSVPSSNGVQSGSLEYEGLVPQGNRAVQTAQQNRIRRALGTSIGGVFDAAGLVENQDGVRLIGKEGAVVYLSFEQRVNKLDDVFYGFELHRGDGNGNRVLCIGNGVDGTGYGVTSNVNVYGPRNFPSLGEENTEPNFFVVRIAYGVGNRDQVTVYRNPKSLTEEGECKVNAELVGNFAFDRISLGNFNGTKIHEVDEIRVGTTFRAVTGRRGRGPDRLVPRVADDALKPWSRGLPPSITTLFAMAARP
ncbi:MAG TPA: FecR domain-containing protein [Lacipirellulaceae bacterium]|nr:FecR domain-containing protein [Lacipirellulaceae bacterium]